MTLKAKKVATSFDPLVEPNPLFRKLYRPLGAIAVTFADMESELTRTLNVLLGTSPNEGAALEWLMQNVSLRIELFYFLAVRPEFIKDEEHITALKKDAESLYGQLKQANADRNNLLHGTWSGWEPRNNTYSKNRLKAEGGKLQEIPVSGVSVELLKEESHYIMSITRRILHWTSKYKRRDQPGLWPAPLPNKFLLHSPLANLFRENKSQARKPQHKSSRE